MQASRQTSTQAGSAPVEIWARQWQASRQASKQAGRQASKQATRQTGGQASKRAELHSRFGARSGLSWALRGRPRALLGARLGSPERKKWPARGTGNKRMQANSISNSKSALPLRSGHIRRPCEGLFGADARDNVTHNSSNTRDQRMAPGRARRRRC